MDVPFLAPRTHYPCVTCQIRQKVCYMHTESSDMGTCDACNHVGIQCLGLERPTWLTSFNALMSARAMIQHHLATLSTDRDNVPSLVFDSLIPLYAPTLGDIDRTAAGDLVETPIRNSMKVEALNLDLPGYPFKVCEDTTSPVEFGASILSPMEVPTEVASSTMSVQEMFDCLLQHGCADLSLHMDDNRTSSIAVAGGAFGDIYRGGLLDGTDVAIKALRHHVLANDKAPKALKRAMRELYIWSKAKHDNVQPLLGVILFQGCLGMVSPWMENGNLEEYIRKNPAADRHQLCTRVANGVSYLHSINMVHGDLKARNILVDQDGTPKLSDFDHSILSECTLAFTETTNVGGGTLRWMAPELLLPSEEGDETPAQRTRQTDVYALGMTVLEIMTGRVPYAEFKVDRAIIRALDKKQFPNRPQELSSHTPLWSLLEACWNHDPEGRPASSSVYDQLLYVAWITDDMLQALGSPGESFQMPI